MNQFAIGYMVNPILYVNKALRYQVEKCLKEKFHSSTQSDIKNLMVKANTYVISLVMFYDNRTMNKLRLFRLLSCVVYYLIDNCVCIDYLEVVNLKSKASSILIKYSRIGVIINCFVLIFQKCQ